MYRIRNLFSRIKRSWRFMKHGWNSTPWYEDVEMLRTIIFSLDELILHFSKYKINSISYSSIQNDLKWIKLAKKLLEMHIDEHYLSLVIDEDDWDIIKREVGKDDKCLRIGMTIIATKSRSWWI
jgi:hypothetical protein